MFVKLLALLFSNVFVSFNILLCCRSLASKCGLKGENKQRKIWSLLVRSSTQMLRLSAPVIEPSVTRLSVPALEPKTHDQAYTTYTQYPHVALAPSHSLLRRGIIEQLSALERKHAQSSALGLHSSALGAIECTNFDLAAFILLINRTLIEFCKGDVLEAILELKHSVFHCLAFQSSFFLSSLHFLYA